MKKTATLLVGLAICLSMQAQVSKAISCTAGGLYSLLSKEERSTVTNLTITGTIDARDFKTMHDSMAKLTEIDISSSNIAAYTGREGTNSNMNTAYLSNDIPTMAFISKKNITSIILPSSLTSIGSMAFFMCKGITAIIIPSLVTSIYSDAFAGCSGLVTVVAENANFTSDDGVLFNKDKTTLIHCPTSKTGNYTVPAQVSVIGSDAFTVCTGLTNIFIPSSVTSIGDVAFSGCSGLDSITLSNSITSLGKNAFSSCTSLKVISLPTSIKAISENLFYDCTLLNTVTFPSSITSIGSLAFYNCKGLKAIYINLIKPINITSSSLIFENVNKTTCVLYVPFGTRTAYAAAAVWKDFTNIVEFAATVTGNITTTMGQLTLYPDPVKDVLFITDLTSPAKATVYSLNGPELLKTSLTGNRLDVSSLPKGVYILQIMNNDRRENVRFVKQ